MGTHKTMSSHRYMETALLDLILYIATFLQPHIAQHFAKYPLECRCAPHAFQDHPVPVQ